MMNRIRTLVVTAAGAAFWTRAEPPHSESPALLTPTSASTTTRVSSFSASANQTPQAVRVKPVARTAF